MSQRRAFHFVRFLDCRPLINSTQNREQYMRSRLWHCRWSIAPQAHPVQSRFLFISSYLLARRVLSVGKVDSDSRGFSSEMVQLCQ